MKTADIIPYVRIGQIIELVRVIPTREVSITALTLSGGLRRTQIKNILPSLQCLGLLQYRNGKITLTKEGQEFRLSVRSNNEERSKRIIKNLIGKLELFTYLIGLLNQEQKLTTEQIGREIAAKYGKVWSHPLTYKTHGAACASMIAFAGHGVYDRGVLRKGLLVSLPGRVALPNVTFSKMTKILQNIYPRGECSIRELSRMVETSPGRLAAEMGVCVELKLVTKEARGVYGISKAGEKLISPVAHEQKSEIFKDCLLKSRYNLIIGKLMDTTFDSGKLGETIVYLFRVQSTPKTQQVYGAKFLNWLKSADVVKKGQGGTYALEKSKLKEKVVVRDDGEGGRLAKPTKPDEQLLKYYRIGKLIGRIIASCEKKTIGADDMEELATMCQEFDRTDNVLVLLSEHRRLFEELRDPRIFLADIKLLENIIIERKEYE